MRWYSHIAVGIFFLVALMEAFGGLGPGITYPWYMYVIHLLLVPLGYACVAWLVMRGCAYLFRRDRRRA